MIDAKALYEAARNHASFETLGRIFGVGATTLSQHPEYRNIIEKARAERRKDLLEAQFSTAIDDRNPAMQIWLGKQYLGQADVRRIETTGADGQAIEHTHNVRAVAYIPENGRDGEELPEHEQADKLPMQPERELPALPAGVEEDEGDSGEWAMEREAREQE